MTATEPTIQAPPEPRAPEPPTLLQRSVRGVSWQILGLGVERLSRFASNVILARMLTKGDFGLLGIVVAAVTAFDALTHVAANEALIFSNRGRERSFQDTLFWISALRGVLLGLALACAAPMLAGYYEEPRALKMFVVVGLFPFFLGLSSPRIGVLEKDLEYRRIALWSLGASLGATALTLGLALWLRSAWALVLGLVGMQAFKAAGSYIVAPFRPRLCFSREHFAEIRTYFTRAAGTPFLIALVLQAPALLLGKFHGTDAVGVFFLNFTLAYLPSSMSLQAIGRVAIPAYSELKDDRVRLTRAWLTALRTIAFASLPLSAVLAMMGNDLPRIVYRDAFVGPDGLFSLLAVGGGLASLLAVTGPLFWGVGRPSYDRWTQLLRVAVIYGLGAWLVWAHAENGLATTLIIGVVAAFGLSLTFVRTIIDARLGDIGRALLPGVGLSVVVVVALAMLHALLGWTGIAKLVIDTILGAIVGGIVLRSIWRERRRPRF